MIKKFDKKDEESGSGSNPFQHLEKSAVLQEARIFNETPIIREDVCISSQRSSTLLNQVNTLGPQKPLKLLCHDKTVPV